MALADIREISGQYDPRYGAAIIDRRSGLGVDTGFDIKHSVERGYLSADWEKVKLQGRRLAERGAVEKSATGIVRKIGALHLVVNSIVLIAIVTVVVSFFILLVEFSTGNVGLIVWASTKDTIQ